MIIDDKHEIAFIHIPKCAGTTIRQYLQPYDRSRGRFTERVDMHEKLGMLDYVHLPLFVLKDHFPEEFHLIQEYWSFAVIRDPYSRFASSVSQRLKMYGRHIQNLSEKEIRKEVWDCIQFLEKNGNKETLLPHDYIHFQRQVDYVYIKGMGIVDDIYTTDQISMLFDDLLEILGSDSGLLKNEMRENKRNGTFVYRNVFAGLIVKFIKPLKGFFAGRLPEKLKVKIKKKLYMRRDEKMNRFFSDPLILSFIGSYYKEDIELYQKVKREK